MQGSFESQRRMQAYRQTIDAEPDVVFPLLCPVRESEWLDGWTCRMIYSASGVAEEGAVFMTSSPGEPDTTWIVSRRDRARHQIDFCRFTPGSRTCLLRIAVAPLPGGRSSVDVSYEYTSVAPAGNEFLQAWTDAAFLEAVRFWEDSMNHFLASGTRLVRPTPA